MKNVSKILNKLSCYYIYEFYLFPLLIILFWLEPALSKMGELKVTRQIRFFWYFGVLKNDVGKSLQFVFFDNTHNLPIILLYCVFPYNTLCKKWPIFKRLALPRILFSELKSPFSSFRFDSRLILKLIKWDIQEFWQSGMLLTEEVTHSNSQFRLF